MTRRAIMPTNAEPIPEPESPSMTDVAPKPPMTPSRRPRWLPTLVGFLVAGLASACEPTVRMEAPREPITINLNIQADIRVKIEEQAKQDIKTYENIF